MGTITESFGQLDFFAAGLFLFFWLCFEYIIDHSVWRHKSLTGLIAHQRREWMLEVAGRDVRIADMAILTGQMNGATFFSSAAILATGGCFALLGATDEVIQVFRDLELSQQIQRSAWEIKTLGLTFIFVYSFFKFAWSYRLFNYCAVMVGAIRRASEENAATCREQAIRAAEMNILAARHFTAGVRAIFFAFAYLGWLIGPKVLIASTLCVMVVLIRRQFFSKSRDILI
jgi:uncharacterized membrane protein